MSADTEAWKNNVDLKLYLNTNGEQIRSYQTGLDVNDSLQEYVIQCKYKVIHKSRQRQKEKFALFDASVKRFECEKMIGIEIKSRPEHTISNNANTNEDEENFHQKQFH